MRLSHSGHISKMLRWLKRGQIGLIFGVLALAGVTLAGINAPTQKIPTPIVATLNKGQVQADSIVTKQETETFSVPYATTNQDDALLPQGQKEIKRKGSNGTEMLTYNVAYTNNVQTSRSLSSTKVTMQPVDQIVAIGTLLAHPSVKPVVSQTTPTPDQTRELAAPISPQPKPMLPPTPLQSCFPLTSGGKCYKPGEYCRKADHYMIGLTDDGENIFCENNNGWRWEPSGR